MQTSLECSNHEQKYVWAKISGAQTCVWCWIAAILYLDPLHNPIRTSDLPCSIPAVQCLTRYVLETSFTYSVVVETILSGHEGWVYGVHWQPAVIGPEAKVTQPIRLLTASMDKTMIVWQPDYDSGIYTCITCIIDSISVNLLYDYPIKLSQTALLINDEYPRIFSGWECSYKFDWLALLGFTLHYRSSLMHQVSPYAQHVMFGWSGEALWIYQLHLYWSWLFFLSWFTFGMSSVIVR